MKSYSIFLNIQREDFLLFLNRSLLRPGHDFIIKDEGFYDGVTLILREELKKNDEICIYVFGDSHWFVFNGEKLVDQSTDISGYTEQYTEWMN